MVQQKQNKVYSKEVSKINSIKESCTDKDELNGYSRCLEFNNGFSDVLNSKIEVKLRKAVTSLLHLVYTKKISKASSTQSCSTPLFASADSIFLLISLETVPLHGKRIPLQIKLPHSIHNEMTEICLVVKDPQRKWKDLIAKEKAPWVQKIIGIKKLEKKYKTFRQKRELCAAFDLFFCDDRVAAKMPSLLGKYFINNKKLPIGIRLRENNFLKPIQSALHSTWMQIRSGPTVGIKVARSDMEVDQIVENSIRVITVAEKFFTEDPKWRNAIVSIHIQATNQPSLPIYFCPHAVNTLLSKPLKNEVDSDAYTFAGKASPTLKIA